jgi:methylthioribose-1-phosphate isomerase
LFDAFKKKKKARIYILEGRPYLDSAKQLSKEMLKREMTPTVIADNMAGVLFFKKLVKEVWVSYRMKDQQEALCDIGGLILAVLGKKHNVPVYLYPADKITKKARLLGSPEDLFMFNGKRTAPQDIKGYVPLVEWVPLKYVTKSVSLSATREG